MEGVLLNIILTFVVVCAGPLTKTEKQICRDRRFWLADGRYKCSKLLGPPDHLGFYKARFRLCAQGSSIASSCCATCAIVNKEPRPPTSPSPTKYVTTEILPTVIPQNEEEHLSRKFSLGKLPKKVWLQMKRLLSAMYDYAYKQQSLDSRRRRRNLM